MPIASRRAAVTLARAHAGVIVRCRFACKVSTTPSIRREIASTKRMVFAVAHIRMCNVCVAQPSTCFTTLVLCSSARESRVHGG
jgi:hypothetical protein